MNKIIYNQLFIKGEILRGGKFEPYNILIIYPDLVYKKLKYNDGQDFLNSLSYNKIYNEHINKFITYNRKVTNRELIKIYYTYLITNDRDKE